MPAPLTINGFIGANQSLDAKQLPDGVGVASVNQRPGKGDFRPWRAPQTVATVPTSPQRLTIWRMGQDVANEALYWLSWTTVVHAIRGFETDDPTERTYFTGSGTPKWTDNTIALATPPYPVAVRELAVPQPTQALTATLNTEAGTTEPQEEWTYTHTFVNDIGWESAPAPVSNAIFARPGSTVDLSNLPAPPAGNYVITLRRIYRSKVGTSGNAEYFFLAEIPIGDTTYFDAGGALGSDVLETGFQGTGSSWLPPPADGHGMVAMWNGMASILSGKGARICEPFKLYAYPLRNELALNHTAVAQAVWGQRMVIFTTGDVYMVTGSDPSSLEADPLKINQPCLSSRSVVAFEDGAAWAGPDGLCWIGNDGFRVLTRGIFDRQPDADNPGPAWSDLNPASMVAGRYQGLIFVFYDAGGGERRGFALDPRNPVGMYELDQRADAVFRDPISDALYLLEGGDIRRFDAGAALLTARFRSKLFSHPAPVNYSWLQVVAKAYPARVRVWADGVERLDRQVDSREPVRLLDGNLADEWQAEVETSAGSVQALRLALTAKDLRQP
jgi:hypothetical protein